MGTAGEQRAVEDLRRRGYRIVAKNYRSPFGELDIIAEHDGSVVFVEVKARSGPHPAVPAAFAVNRAKQSHIIKAAQHFLKRRRWVSRPCRFDVAVIHDPSQPTMSIEWIEGAFVVPS